MNKRIGIDAMGFYFPNQYVVPEELLLARGEKPSKATKGLGVQRMAVLASNEDSVTMAANAVDNLDCPKERISKLVFATECGLDSAKDNASHVVELCGLPENCEAYDVKAACAASTYGLWQVIDWILSGRGRGKLGLVVCSDKAVYEHKTGAEITGGGGAVALLISEDPSMISFDLEMGDYKSNVRDFWKPLGNECAVMAEDGKPSIEAYLNSVSPTYKDYINNGGNQNFGYLVFHTPYAKMVCKAFTALTELKPEIQGKFESMTADSLKAPSLVGNIYNGSLYLALASLLEIKGRSARGKGVGLYSFGSGSSSKFFRGVVNPEFTNHFDLFKQLESMNKLSPEKYDLLRQGEIIIKETRGFTLNGVDQQKYRHYTKV